jgi:DNA polymerase-3 subunit alpha
MYGKELNRRAVESLIRAGAFDNLGYKRRQLLQVVDKVIEGVAGEGHKNIDGQLDLFAMEGGVEERPSALVLPEVPEFTPQELMAMEKETTGMYLSGHPMDQYRSLVRNAGVVPIGAILGDFSAEEGPQKFRDNQTVTVAGIVSSAKTRATRNNSLMCYITLEDDTGAMELLAFQKALDSGGGYIRENAIIIVKGRISLRDENEQPQLVVESIRPISDLGPVSELEPPPPKEKKLYVKLPSAGDPAMARLEKLLIMFPGNSQMVLYFEDTKKKMGARCLIHEALVEELREMFGSENVVVK